MACSVSPVQCLCQSHSHQISRMPKQVPGPPSQFVSTVARCWSLILRQRLLVATCQHVTGVARHPIRRHKHQQRSLWGWLGRTMLV